MLFNSLEFLIFFPVVVAVYFLTPYRYRWVWLLGASYYFYASWKAEYLLLIVLSTLVDYGAALRMGALSTRSERRPYLALSLATNLGLLFAFKYFNLFNDTARTLFEQWSLSYHVPAFDVLLPVGISFYTFQTLSYSIDVYRGNIAPERHLGLFALYVSFFPQLVAGPIERPQNLLPQFRTPQPFNWTRLRSGLQLMLWGFFLKLVVADRAAIFANAVYADPGAFSGWSLWLGTYLFAFQIYGDFAGYSLIAIGTARLMGYDLMQNFRRPYFAKSISEFWSRWHISLSTWFRDYLYIPLGGNRVPRYRWYANLFIVFTVSGLWHGASWAFMAWGALHGFYLIFGLLTEPLRTRFWSRIALLRTRRASTSLQTAGLSFARFSTDTLRRWIAVACTFHLVVFAWIFFRAGTLSEALTVVRNAFDFESPSASLLWVDHPLELLLTLAAIGVMLGVHLLQRRCSAQALLDRQPRLVRWAVYYGLVLTILLFGKFNSQEFLYFQF